VSPPTESAWVSWSLRNTQADSFLLDGAGPSAVRMSSGRLINVALTEALLVALARRFDAPGEPEVSQLPTVLATLMNDRSFVDSVSFATASDEKVRTRLAKATEAFANI